MPREDRSEAVALPREDHSEQAAEPAESIVESEPLPQIEEQVVIPENVMPIPPRVQQARKVPAYLKDYVTTSKDQRESSDIYSNCLFYLNEWWPYWLPY